MDVIHTDGLTKRYGELTAVDHASFSVERGQVFGFLGPNGSGKTTTIGMLLGIITPTAGRLHLFGRTGSRGLHEARQRVGATLEQPNFYPYLSGRDNLTLVANVKGAAHTAVDRVLEVVGLAGRERDRFRTYSLGMKQRLALAATMLGDPELIILDEPANGLDPEGIREVREVILRLAGEGKTIFLSSHLLGEVERTCSHVAVIRRGRIVRQSSVHDMVTDTAVAELRAPDMAALEREAAAYPDALHVKRAGDTMIVALKDGDPGALNRWLAARGVWLSHLALRRRSLEEVFFTLTGAEDPAAPEPAYEEVA